MKVDERNRYFFGGKLEKETIRSWGHDRYLLRKLGPMVSTRMAVDPNAPKVDSFVAVAGEPRLVCYNSRLAAGGVRSRGSRSPLSPLAPGTERYCG